MLGACRKVVPLRSFAQPLKSAAVAYGCNTCCNNTHAPTDERPAHADDAASFIRRFLRHSAFNTKAKRVGHVVCVSEVGLRAWWVGEDTELILKWDK